MTHEERAKELILYLRQHACISREDIQPIVEALASAEKKGREELRTRVASLEKNKEFYDNLPQLQSCEECSFPMTDFGTPRGLECQLCDARERIKEQAIDEEKLTNKCDELQTRLSTLLKASEGMEKALEELDKLGRCWIQHNVMGSAGFISGAAVCERTQPALADFMAVKEWK